MTTEEILALAHREAWRYRQSSDPHHSDTYTFNRSTLLEFARKLVAAEREACAKMCDGIKYEGYVPPEDGRAAEYYEEGAEECADKIRARSRGSTNEAA